MMSLLSYPKSTASTSPNCRAASTLDTAKWYHYQQTTSNPKMELPEPLLNKTFKNKNLICWTWHINSVR
jgi:hypothetical protein